jgi:hypothetical protein
VQLTMEQVFDLIRAERERQDAKWGADKKQTCAGFLLVLEAELDEAKAGWMKNVEGKHSAMREIVQVAAVAVAALQQHGPEGNGL